jgi:hypothetical protein
MDEGDTFPLTTGQLSTWQDLVAFTPEQQWEANFTFAWDIPDGVSLERAWAAVAQLGVRHESLRTTFVVDPAGQPWQRVGPPDPDWVLATAGQGTADVADLPALEAAQQRRAFDLTSDVLWRVWILTRDGRPHQVFVILNHMAADAAALVILMRDFRGILAGEPLPPAGTPRELARWQRENLEPRTRKAEAYWRRVLAEAPLRSGPVELGPPVGVNLWTGIPVAVGQAAAARLGISASALVAAAYGLAVARVTGADRILLISMSNNRFHRDLASVVTSVNEWVPQIVDYDPGQPFEEAAYRVHTRLLNAHKHGLYHPDPITAARVEARDRGIDPGYHLNAMVAPTGDPDAPMEPPRIEWYDCDRGAGPACYLTVRALTTFDLLFRIRRRDLDRATITAILGSIQDTLTAAVAAPVGRGD